MTYLIATLALTTVIGAWTMLALGTLVGCTSGYFRKSIAVNAAPVTTKWIVRLAYRFNRDFNQA